MTRARHAILARPVAAGEFDPDPDATACRMLWCAVLKDQWDLVFSKSRSVPLKGIGDRADAQRWFGSNSFWTVCALAGVEGEAVLSSFRAELTAAQGAAA